MSPQFVLTAAHCFTFGNLPEHIIVEINDGAGKSKKNKQKKQQNSSSDSLENIVFISRERPLLFFLNLWQPCSTGKKVKKVIIHPSFNINAKAAAGVREYYDYDVALIQLETDVHISRAARWELLMLKCGLLVINNIEIVEFNVCFWHPGQAYLHTLHPGDKWCSPAGRHLYMCATRWHIIKTSYL